MKDILNDGILFVRTTEKEKYLDPTTKTFYWIIDKDLLNPKKVETILIHTEKYEYRINVVLALKETVKKFLKGKPVLMIALKHWYITPIGDSEKESIDNAFSS